MVHRKISDDWQDFLERMEDKEKKQRQSEIWMNLDGEQAHFMINIFERAKGETTQLRESLLCLPAQFKVSFLLL